MTRIAAIADIHGNLPALEAVVSDAARWKADSIVNLGDHASGPLWPSETIAYLMRQDWVQIAGNCDRQLLRCDAEDLGPSDRFALERLSVEERQWLAGLPPNAVVCEEVRLVHGTPSDDTAYLLETVEDGHARLARPGEIVQRLGGVAGTLVLCGHSHIARVVRTSGVLIVNPGSVGLPAYDHDVPQVHVMESGSPDARYALLERTSRGWSAALVTVPYDNLGAAHRAEQNGRPDWASALRTGYMS